jgi:hypothetical protein
MIAEEMKILKKAENGLKKAEELWGSAKSKRDREKAYNCYVNAVSLMVGSCYKLKDGDQFKTKMQAMIKESMQRAKEMKESLFQKTKQKIVKKKIQGKNDQKVKGKNVKKRQNEQIGNNSENNSWKLKIDLFFTFVSFMLMLQTNQAVFIHKNSKIEFSALKLVTIALLVLDMFFKLFEFEDSSTGYLTLDFERMSPSFFGKLIEEIFYLAFLLINFVEPKITAILVISLVFRNLSRCRKHQKIDQFIRSTKADSGSFFLKIVWIFLKIAFFSLLIFSIVGTSQDSLQDQNSSTFMQSDLVSFSLQDGIKPNPDLSQNFNTYADNQQEKHSIHLNN